MDKESKNDPTAANYADTSQLSVPQINLPRGGGALRNIDEKFQVNPANGTASFSLPLSFSKSRSGFGPNISLGYNSGSGNGPFGLGWSIDLSSIQRRTDKLLPSYEDAEESDVFQITGAEDLVPCLDKNNNYQPLVTTLRDGTSIKRYRPRIESAFTRIERISLPGAGTGVSGGVFFWRATSRNNVVTLFGRSQSARVADPSNPSRIFKWLPELSFDDRGNCMEYTYVAENILNVPSQVNEKNRLLPGHGMIFTNTYLKKISYGNLTPYATGAGAVPSNPYNPSTPQNPQYLFEAVFDYGDHAPDNPGADPTIAWPCRLEPFSNYKPGFEIRTYRLCQRILFFHCFKELNTDASQTPYLVRSLNLGYNLFRNAAATAAQERNAEADYIVSLQRYGYIKQSDGTYSSKNLPPVEFTYQGLSWEKTIRDVTPENLAGSPVGIGDNYQWLDLWSEGVPGILSEQGNGWFYKSNLGRARFSQANPVFPKPSFLGLKDSHLQLQDLDGDGRKFIVGTRGPVKGSFGIDEFGQWQPFRPFDRVPALDFNDPFSRFIDLNGDGRPDLVVSEENVFTWYPGNGIAGYDSPKFAPKPYDEEQGPAMVFADATQSIFLADMSGDGLTDILRIRNGEVCYWPNTGYGRFGAKVNMGYAPVFDVYDQFNPAYLHLADVNGTGATDIIYLGRNRCSIWLNLSGNAWSEVQEIDFFPATALPDTLTVTDFLGSGTSCIVWSSPLPDYTGTAMRYIDLLQGIKPYIMTGYKNNFGKEVAWIYESSTRFYLDDKIAGKPWVTKLAFPVQCVQKITTDDVPAGTHLSSTYSYHHGYYDWIEKEFRGFGRVEQTDAETFDGYVQSGNNAGNTQSIDQAPVRMITWYHTGAYIDELEILAQFASEYNVGPTEFALPQPELPDILTAGECREAFRACKGMVLRQEIYALDNSALAGSPYSVTKHNCQIQLLQPRLGNPYAVFLNTPSESVSFGYERNVDDPRISHTLNFTIDQWGNVLESADVAYGRLQADTALPAAIQAVQATTLVTYINNTYTANYFDVPAVYRLPMLAETKQYEITGLGLAGKPFQPQDLTQAGVGKNLIGDKRRLYLANDLSTELALGQMDMLGLPSQTYSLALTPATVTTVFGAKVTGAMLTAVNYLQPDTTNWWIPSGKNIYLNAGEAISAASQRFYLPVAVQDPLGTLTLLFYDSYCLVLTGIVDVMANKTSAYVDYRTLQPIRLVDMNDNTSEILADELGMVIATSVYGKEGDGPHGDTPLYTSVTPLVVSFNALLPATLDALITGPGEFLQQATSFFFYDFFAWVNAQQPACFAGVQRQTHVSELAAGAAAPVFMTVGYTGGLGRILQTKMQAEPGMAQQWDPVNKQVVQVNANTRWIGTGRTIMNNKGNPVKQYEPFFSATYQYESEQALVESGFSSTLYYDPPGRVIRVDEPNGTYTTKQFDAWSQYIADENDNVLGSDWYTANGSPAPGSPQPTGDVNKRAAWLAARDADTPAQQHFDPLGRTVYAIADNGIAGKYGTQSILDIQGNALQLIDPLANTVMQYSYDLVCRRLWQTGMDGGTRWTFPDVLGQPVYAWDSRNHRFRNVFDALRRPAANWLQADVVNNSAEMEIAAFVYGENQANDTMLNLRGKPYQTYDQSGLLQNTEYDFQGNAKSVLKQLALDYKDTVDFNVGNRTVLLDPNQIYQSSAKFNAVGKPVQLVFPDGSQVTPVYNKTNLLSGLNTTLQNPVVSPIQNFPQNPVAFIQNIGYNAKNQRLSILYGNNSSTSYSYDATTYRLTRLLTTRNSGADILQDLNYTYDPVGNITDITDNAQQTLFFNNAQVNPGNSYTYDAIYRLTIATGREYAGQNAPSDQFDNDKMLLSGQPLVLPGDMAAMQNYQQDYQYDDAGNMTQLKHNAGNGALINQWTRTFEYNNNAADRLTNGINAAAVMNNHLLNDWTGANRPATTGAEYGYDAHGNLQNLQAGVFDLTWNYADQLQQVDLGGGGTAYYVYDLKGERVRKVIVNGDSIKDRAYPGGGYECYNDSPAGLQRTTLHIMDDKSRIALVETVTKGGDQGLPFLIRYQYGNHLGTSVLELDGAAAIISYEEYYPYGSTAYQAGRNQTDTPKRYRYTGKERDTESGLYYHGARYYAPWLVRWVSCDPIGLQGGLNFYSYVNANPVSKNDPKGTQDKAPAELQNPPPNTTHWTDPQTGQENYKTVVRARRSDNGAGQVPDQGDGSADLSAEIARRQEAATKQGFDDFNAALSDPGGQRAAPPDEPIFKINYWIGFVLAALLTISGSVTEEGEIAETREMGDLEVSGIEAQGLSEDSGALKKSSYSDKYLRQKFRNEQSKALQQLPGEDKVRQVLLDPDTGRLRSGRGLEDSPGFEAGHADARSSGMPQRFFIQDADRNALGGQTIESAGNYSSFQGVEIRPGIHVELGTAEQLERMGELPLGTVKFSPPSRGWIPPPRP